MSEAWSRWAARGALRSSHDQHRQGHAGVRYTQGITLASKDGDCLAEALMGWIRAKGEPFAVIADAAGLSGSDAEYRAKASGFFQQDRDAGRIALINLQPSDRGGLFRVVTGIQLQTFASEARLAPGSGPRASRL